MTTERSPADAERDHQEAFGTHHQWVFELVDRVRSNDRVMELVDRVRRNDPSLTEMMLNNEMIYLRLPLLEDDLLDRAWELLSRYNVAANTYLEDISLLTGSSSLETLSLTYQRFGSDGIRSIVPFLNNSPNLLQIDFSHNRNITSECFEAIVEALNGGPIVVLIFNGCSINDIAALENVTLPHLRALNLNNNGIERVPPLDHLANLETLHLGDNNIQTIPSLEMLTNLKYLWLSDNRIGNGGCKEIAKLLRSAHSSLQELHLERSNIALEGAEILADSLKSNFSLKFLQLGGNDLNEAGYRAFSKLLNDVSSVEATLASNHTLTLLVLPRSSNSVSTELMEKHIGKACGINHRTCKGNAYDAASRAKVIATQLNSTARRELCGLQGVEYSYDSMFGGIDPILLPNLLAMTSRSHGQTELHRMLLATAPDLTSLMNAERRNQDKVFPDFRGQDNSGSHNCRV